MKTWVTSYAEMATASVVALLQKGFWFLRSQP